MNVFYDILLKFKFRKKFKNIFSNIRETRKYLVFENLKKIIINFR